MGDERAFEVLVQRHEQRVRATVYGMLGQTDGTEDIAQEVFIRFFQKLDEFRGDARVSTFLIRIAINLSLNEIKRRKRKGRWMINWKSEDPPPAAPDPNAHPGRFETRELVWKGLSQLEPDYRAVLVLRLLEGYSVKETAAVLGIPQGTVASRLARGQQILKNILAPWL